MGESVGVNDTNFDHSLKLPDFPPGVSPGGLPNWSGQKPSMFSMLDWFRRILIQDLPELRAMHRKWKQNDELIRNTGDGFLDGGNIAAEFTSTLVYRMFSKPISVRIDSSNPDADTSASDLEVVAQSLVRTSDTKTEVEYAFRDAQWANTGWVSIDHPMNPVSLEFMRRRDMQLSTLVNPEDTEDDWVPADRDGMLAAGIDPDDEYEVDPTFRPPSMAKEPPKPLFAPLFGSPYVKRIDPRLMLLPPKNSRTMEDAWYVGRLHFFSPRELARLFPDLAGKGLPYNLNGDLLSIYREVNTNRPEMQYAQIVCVVEVYFKRCALFPDLNGRRVIFLWNYPNIVLYNERSPYGGMIPFVPVKPIRLKNLLDASKAEELRNLALAYNAMVTSIADRAAAMENIKWFEGAGAGLKDGESKKITRRDYSGPIKVGDANQVKFLDVPISNSALMMLTFLRSQGQVTMGTSEMDNGKAVKDITARQVEILNNATSANIDSVRDELKKAVIQIVLMLIHFASLYSHLERGSNYQFNGRSVYIERGRPDLLHSALFEIQIQEDGEDLSADDRLVLNQFVRVILQDPTGSLFAKLDKDKLLRVLLRKFGLSYSELIGDPTALPVNGANNPSIPGATTLQDSVDGQHPERQLGDRGLGVAQALDGLRSIGS